MFVDKPATILSQEMGLSMGHLVPIQGHRTMVSCWGGPWVWKRPQSESRGVSGLGDIRDSAHGLFSACPGKTIQEQSPHLILGFTDRAWSHSHEWLQADGVVRRLYSRPRDYLPIHFHDILNIRLAYDSSGLQQIHYFRENPWVKPRTRAAARAGSGPGPKAPQLLALTWPMGFL